MLKPDPYIDMTAVRRVQMSGITGYSLGEPQSYEYDTLP